VPFEKLVQELAPERSLAHAPLFQVMLAVQNAPAGMPEIRDLHLRPLLPPVSTAKFDLSLSLAESSGGMLLGTVEHATDLFDPATIDRLILHHETLLTAALAAPEVPFFELPLLSPAELHQALAEWNDTGTAGIWHESVAFLVERRARERPGDPAVVDAAGAVLTYGELDERAGRLAGFLRALGVGPETVVPVVVERSPALVAGLLGVLKAGAAYLPLDPSYPAERLSLMLEESAARVVLAQEALLDRLPSRLSDTGVRIVCLDRDREEIERHPSVPAARVEPDNLAYVIYTSGSTGRPKGVQIPHRGLMNLVRWDLRVYGTGPEDRRTLVANLGFDGSVWEVWACLASGAALHLPTEEVRLDPRRLGSWMAGRGITVSSLTTALAEALLTAEGVEIPTLRRLLVGGERLRLSPDPSCGFALINHYGPTETSVLTTAGVVPPRRYPGTAETGETGPAPSLGRPIDGQQIYLSDRRLLPVPPGVAGELWVGGPSLARGYLGDSGRTAERFVPNPFGATPGERLYRTGDLCRHRMDGTLEFLGRVDHQVKIRGFRIELGEVEAVLAALPGVSQAVVIAREDRSNRSTAGLADRRLVAYVVGTAAAEELRRLLRERLPESMIPAAFVMLAELPLTPHGKVDRKALPAPEWQSRGEGRLMPRTPVEEVLAGIWAEVLGVSAGERLGADASFFDLGGHSLLATQVMSRLRDAFGVEMPVRDLFEAPVLADLAVRVEAARRAGAGLIAPPLLPVPREGPLPLSFAQRRLWFIDQLAPGSPLYNMPVVLRAEGPLDAGVLALSLGEIVRRHEALRTAFAVEGLGGSDGEPVQVIQPAVPFLLPVVDLSWLAEKDREATAAALAQEEALRPLDLSGFRGGPLLRGVLLRLRAEDQVVMLTMHHIASDGWSMGILVREVVALYEAFAAGRPSPLPELLVQYADFAVWQGSWLRGEVLEGEIGFWRRQLAGLPPLHALPTDRPRPAKQSFRGASRPVRLPAELTRQAESLARREGATLFMVLLAGFQALLARSSGPEDFAVGSPVAGRNRVEIEGLIGFFVNTLVLRGDLSGTPSFRELLGRVRETALAAWLHQDVPFEKLVEALAPERSLAHAPLFQVMFALQNAPVESLEIETLRLRPVRVDTTAAKFDLTVSLAENPDGTGGLTGAFEYATDLFDAATIDRLVGHFERLLLGIVEQPDHRVAEVGLLDAAETLQLASWNATAREYPHACIHELFAEQAERAPDAVAVTVGGRSLTYGELHRRSTHLAQRLRNVGMGIGSLVGLCAEGLPEMVTGMLGILAAGGAYVPLDPAYPRERLALLLEDTGAGVLVTEESLAGRLPAREGLRVELLAGSSAGGPRLARLSSLRFSPDDPAYVIYTSGSTGRPKGVVVPHRAVVRLVRGTDYVQLGPDDRVAQAANSSFDATTFEVWGALLNGGRLVGIERQTLLAPDLLSETLRREGVTALFLTTALFNQMAREAPGGFAPLRCLLFGGELVDPAAVRAVLRDGPERLLHVYGPTETTTFATWHPVESVASVAPGATVPIGQPLANGTLHVLAAGLTPQPVGVPGELYLGGDGLAHGYHARPELTAERFVPDPLARTPGSRLYRTGDLVRRGPDGPVEFLGRLDGQVKIRGFRIEPGEIETALLALPGVQEVVVVVREDRPAGGEGDRRLVAYVVGDAAADALRRGLRERLPEYMVPAAFVMLPALPLNPNGKVDRKALPAPADVLGEPQASYVPPRTDLEERIARVWREVLGVERVGVEDSFFDLGGHSLLLIRVMSRLREVLGRDLPNTLMFEHPTVASLAAALGGSPDGSSDQPAAPAPALEQSRDRAVARRESLRRRPRRGEENA